MLSIFLDFGSLSFGGILKGDIGPVFFPFSLSLSVAPSDFNSSFFSGQFFAMCPFFLHFRQVMVLMLCLSLSSVLLLFLSSAFQLSKPSNEWILACIALMTRSSLWSQSVSHLLQFFPLVSTLYSSIARSRTVPRCIFSMQVQ